MHMQWAPDITTIMGRDPLVGVSCWALYLTSLRSHRETSKGLRTYAEENDFPKSLVNLQTVRWQFQSSLRMRHHFLDGKMLILVSIFPALGCYNGGEEVIL